MNKHLIFLALISCMPLLSNCQAQDQGHDKIQSRTYREGIDSVRNVKWWEQPVGPEADDVVKLEVELNRPDLLIVLYCDSSFFTLVTPNNPPKYCVDQLLVEQKTNRDSSSSNYLECVINHYVTNSNTNDIDTIWIENDWAIDDIRIPGLTPEESNYFLTKMELYNDDSTYFTVTEFYIIKDLKNVCVSSNFRLKSVESYQESSKHGKWKYWNKDGIKTKEIEYEHGKKIKETIY